MREPERPALPLPTRQRWQPLRLGLVELFHYDSEEFWFRDGHLLLRGNNGTGKSKVLSLTLPFLFDAQLKPSRIEPDGDTGKKMAWNLLLNSYERRIGYAWIEFGRLAEDGTPHYLTLGAGLSAAAARPQVDSWFFVLEGADGAPRINQDLWLTNDQRVVLSKERLRDALEGRGQVFDTAAAYRRAVDERLFHLGTEALRRADGHADPVAPAAVVEEARRERAVACADRGAAAAGQPRLLADVAEALNQLEEDRRQLEEYQALAKAVERFDQRYRVYAGTPSRRQARALRQAQTEFDNASRARSEAQARLQAAEPQEARASAERDEAELALARQRARLDTLLADPTMQDANRLEGAARDAAARDQALQAAQAALAEFEPAAGARGRRNAATPRSASSRPSAPWPKRAGTAASSPSIAGLAGAFAAQPAGRAGQRRAGGAGATRFRRRGGGVARAAVAGRREQIALLRRRHAELAQAEALRQQRLQARDERQEAVEAAALRREQADAGIEREGQALHRAWERHLRGLRQLRVDADGGAAALADWVARPAGRQPGAAGPAAGAGSRPACGWRRGAWHWPASARRSMPSSSRCSTSRAGSKPASMPRRRRPTRARPSARSGRAGAPLWQLLDFRDAVEPPQRAGLEAALEASGLLDAWVTPDGQAAGCATARHAAARQPGAGARAAPGLAGALAAAGASRPTARVAAERRRAAARRHRLRQRRPGRCRKPGSRRTAASASARWPAHGTSRPRSTSATRRAPRPARKRLAEIAAAPGAAGRRTGGAAAAARSPRARRAARRRGVARRPARPGAAPGAAGGGAVRARLPARARAAGAGRRTVAAPPSRPHRPCARRWRATPPTCACPTTPPRCRRSRPRCDGFDDAQRDLLQAARELRLALPAWQRQREREAEAQADVQQREEQFAASRIEAEEARARLQVLRDAVGAKVDELQQQLAAARSAVSAGENALKAAHEALQPSRRGARAPPPRRPATPSSTCSSAATRAPRPSRGCSSSPPPACCRPRCRSSNCPTWRRLDHRPGADAGAPRRAGCSPTSTTTMPPGRACSGRSPRS